jgi:prevent-host-death family protein
MADIWRVTATEVKNSWGRIVKQVLQERQPALVESKGKPTVVILPADEYERLVAEQDADMRKRAHLAHLDEAEQFARKVATRYTDRPLPNSVKLLQEIREARDDELLDLR